MIKFPCLKSLVTVDLSKIPTLQLVDIPLMFCFFIQLIPSSYFFLAIKNLFHTVLTVWILLATFQCCHLTKCTSVPCISDKLTDLEI